MIKPNSMRSASKHQLAYACSQQPFFKLWYTQVAALMGHLNKSFVKTTTDIKHRITTRCTKRTIPAELCVATTTKKLFRHHWKEHVYLTKSRQLCSVYVVARLYSIAFKISKQDDCWLWGVVITRDCAYSLTTWLSIVTQISVWKKLLCLIIWCMTLMPCMKLMDVVSGTVANRKGRKKVSDFDATSLETQSGRGSEMEKIKPKENIFFTQTQYIDECNKNMRWKAFICVWEKLLCLITWCMTLMSCMKFMNVVSGTVANTKSRKRCQILFCRHNISGNAKRVL